MNKSMMTSIELDEVEVDFWTEEADPSVGAHAYTEVECITVPGAKDSDPRIDITHLVNDDYKELLCNDFQEYQRDLAEAADDDRYQAMKESRAEEEW